GSEDMRRQAPNVERMGLLGAEVRPVEFGTKTLKEATSEAIRDWITNVETTHYLIGSCVGPAPYPKIVGELQAVIGREAREQILEAEGRLPEVAVACVGGGSNAIGLFAGFLEDPGVRLLGVEAGGAASLGSGRTAVLHGSRAAGLADEDGQVVDAEPISDPRADGPVIHRAAERALAQGMRTGPCLEVLAATRGRLPDTPLIPMTYSSLLEAYGWERFAADAHAAGATSLIVADLPAGERRELRRVQLVAPTSTDERIRLAAAATDGWLYLVTLTGTTGARAELSPAPAGLLERAQAWADLHGHELVVVFDGSAPAGAIGTKNESADDWLICEVPKHPGAWLVTSDRALRAAAGVNADRVIGGGSFLGELQK